MSQKSLNPKPISERLVKDKLPVRRALAQIGVSRPTFYRWYDLYSNYN